MSDFETLAAFYFGLDTFALVVIQEIEGRWSMTKGHRKESEINYEIVAADEFPLSVDRVRAKSIELRKTYPDIDTVIINNPLMKDYIVDDYSLFSCQPLQLINSDNLISLFKALLTDKLIDVGEELKDKMNKEIGNYHPKDNETPIVTALLMCLENRLKTG